MGQMVVLNQKGDETIEWDKSDADSVASAENRFNDLKKKGYRFYEAIASKGAEVKKFSPDLGKIIAAPATRPAMAGGPSVTVSG